MNINDQAIYLIKEARRELGEAFNPDDCVFYFSKDAMDDYIDYLSTSHILQYSTTIKTDKMFGIDIKMADSGNTYMSLSFPPKYIVLKGFSHTGDITELSMTISDSNNGLG